MSIRSSLILVACLALTGAALVHAASLSKADKEFMTFAAKTNMTEAHEGEMAENRATRSDLKALAKNLVDDHTRAYQDLTALATQVGVSIPKGINTAQDPTLAHLVHLKGADFDREFARDEIASHKHALAVYKREAEHGENADVKAYASKMLPILEKHLHLAEESTKPAKAS